MACIEDGSQDHSLPSDGQLSIFRLESDLVEKGNASGASSPRHTYPNNRNTRKRKIDHENGSCHPSEMMNIPAMPGFQQEFENADTSSQPLDSVPSAEGGEGRVEGHVEMCPPPQDHGDGESDFALLSQSPETKAQHDPPVGGKPRYLSAQHLFDDVAQETKTLISQMADNFRSSEDFESACLQNVESLLEEAKALEDSLLQQKDILQQRLYLISQTLTSHQPDS